MKIQCDVCEKAPATVICCADEAALCARCDVEVHAANKLASKHQRLLLEWLSNKLPRCDICQEKAAFIFCVEDRALFCRDCDGPLHVAGSHSGSHQRFLATGIRVALTDDSAANPTSEPPNDNPQLVAPALQQAPPPFTPSAWAVDDFLQLSDYESGADKKEPSVGFGELDWFTDISLFQDQMAAAEVPELTVPQANNAPFYRPSKSSMPFKKQRIEMVSNDDEYFTVPDLG